VKILLKPAINDMHKASSDANYQLKIIVTKNIFKKSTEKLWSQWEMGLSLSLNLKEATWH